MATLPPVARPISTARDVARVQAEALLAWIHDQQFHRAHCERKAWNDASLQDQRHALKQAAKALGYDA